MIVDETPLFFPGAEGPLFGVRHGAQGSARHEGVVFCHPLGEEKLWTHRVFVTFARELAGRGYEVLRFDCRGNGDSLGDFSESSVSTMIEDTQAAIDQLRSGRPLARVHLVGLRFGAAIAALTAEVRSDIDRLVLWAPIVDGARYAQELLRINVTTQLAVFREVRRDRAALVSAMQAGGTANVDGYEMSLPFYDELSAVTLAEPRRHAGPTLVVQLDRAETAPVAADVRRLVDACPAATLVQVREEPFWKEIDRFYERAPNLFAATLAWLEQA